MVAFFLISYVLLCVFAICAIDKRATKKRVEIKEEKEKKLIESGYIRPHFKELTQEQIDDIHARGKITPAEKVKEWEGMDLCAPGDAIGSAAWRCKKFDNCHDCLVDYASDHDEYTSFFDILKECKPYKI